MPGKSPCYNSFSLQRSHGKVADFCYDVFVFCKMLQVRRWLQSLMNIPNARIVFC